MALSTEALPTMVPGPEVKHYGLVPYPNTSRVAIMFGRCTRLKRLEEEGRREINEDVIFESYARMRERGAGGARDEAPALR
jgi:hypothetical protein